jgi:rhamnose transport system ATP-binding protein
MELQAPGGGPSSVPPTPPGMASVPERSASPAGVPRLSVRGISKSYEGIHALADVSFDVMPGEIHALVGENGAGKSTLVKIITGLVVPDAGEILLDGRPVSFATPMAARESGVGAVYQDPKLFPHLDVAENIFMGIFPRTRAGTVDRRRTYAEAERLLGELEVDLSPQAVVAGLSVAELQFVGIARALTRDLGLLILDEPTAALTPSEADRLFAIVRALRARGTSIIFISHRLEELFGFVDSVTVLRDGRHVESMPIGAIDQSGLVRLMVGRSLENLYRRTADDAGLGEERLRTEGLTLTGAFRDISFSVRAGEVVTLAGLVGAGRTEIAEAIFGIVPPESGKVWINGQEVTVRDPRQMMALGVAYLPEDRDGQGLVTAFSIGDNITLPIIRRLSRSGFLQPRSERELATKVTTDLQVKMAGIDQVVAALSGGNRQKVVLAKWLATEPTVLILDEPTHGIDVGTKAQVHQLVAELARRGLAILVISSDLPEVLAISSRILVIHEGFLAAEFAGGAVDQEQVMLAATGHGQAVPA